MNEELNGFRGRGKFVFNMGEGAMNSKKGGRDFGI